MAEPQEPSPNPNPIVFFDIILGGETFHSSITSFCTLCTPDCYPGYALVQGRSISPSRATHHLRATKFKFKCSIQAAPDSSAGEPLGRVKMELFADVVPRTAENFRQFCTGETKNPLGIPQGYKGCKFHRVIPGFMIQGGDFLKGNGTGSLSIYGSAFADENFQLSHDEPFLLSMANSGPNSNGCQFFITVAPTAHLNNKHVVFGKVVDGFQVVKMIENTRVANEKPIQDVVISECGEM
ncbi:hypothetical protein K402DRAFT_364726 [Aulographum hederae CBS 113979]|uniref:Peptidyl-prolyl cis-trans isomerase n=1 Tax=Aulographum hederae CBS 113979 TaxID=1176131 RepID=A0A6G1GKG9_9PEZI|nr:hypothetical protein K402DRAFT_364726 [Aulographum hederae CBS 113979]